MDKNEMLTLSYSTLHNMLDDAQHDGLFADGCCYDLDYDIDEEIKRNIESGDIKMVEYYNNGDYISRQTMIQLALDGKIISTDIEKRVRDFINELPAADVQPVKRGEWEESENELNKFCSCCKKVCGTIYDTENYCPNCGADMRGGKPNE